MNSTPYRADIDGLRAIAVLSVIIFHAEKTWLPGGFVGVDVFFVISGYVITKSLMSQKGSITSILRGFYDRRIRRLLPAAVAVVIYTSVMAWFLLPPAEMREYTHSLAAFMTFWSNWFFWSIADYFDGPSDLKPLLHTWSLSIEEQFYLLFPVPMLLMLRKGTRRLTQFFGAVALLSFLVSCWLVWRGGTEAAFFNSLGRFWEIAFGGYLALLSGRLRLGPSNATVVGSVGAAAILASFFLINERTPFPGIAALLPTLGSAAVIAAGTGPVNKALSSGLLTWVGRISYGLYLWHWPIFVTITYAAPGAGPALYVAGIATTFGVASASYYLLEQPVRSGRWLRKPQQVFGMAGGIISLVLAAGAIGVTTNGLPQRLPESTQTYARWLGETLGGWYSETQRNVCWVVNQVDLSNYLSRCVTPSSTQLSILLLGDSHAAHLLPGLKARLPNADIDLLAVDACPLVSIKQNANNAACFQLVDWMNKGLPAGYDLIALSSRSVSTANLDEFKERALRIARDHEVVVFGPIPFYQPNMPTLYPTIADRPAEQIDAAFDAALQPQQAQLDRLLADAFADTAIRYVSLYAAACPSRCRHLDSQGHPVLIDNSHMSPLAARELFAALRFP